MNMRIVITNVFIILSCLITQGSIFAEEVLIKIGTMGPKTTGAGMAAELFNTVGAALGENLGTPVKAIGYFGGVMGDDPQMVQKAQLGQLDMLTPTSAGLAVIEKRFEVFSMAYLIDNYGQYDYVIRKNARFINNLFWERGWVSFIIFFTEGEHNLYMDKPYRTVEEMSANLKAANYTGDADRTFFDPMNINQLPIAATELFPTFRAGVCNAAVLASLFVVGMQIYSSLNYIVYPAVRVSSASIVLTKRKWETMPWDLRAFFAYFQPVMYWLLAGMVRDMANAFSSALVSHGSKEIRLTPDEFKKWKDKVLAYRETYLSDDKLKRELYNRIVESINEYNTGNPIEREIHEKDTQYINFPDKIATMLTAAEEYYKTGSKKSIVKLTDDKIIEKWRLCDPLVASETYYKTGSLKELKAWMKSYYIDEFVEDLFTNHVDSVKRVFGDKNSMKQRLDEVIKVGRFFLTQYTGYQKGGIGKQKLGFSKEYSDKIKKK